MKTTRTYLQGCTWCNASGFVPSNNFGMNTTPLTNTCPVCNGVKTIVVTEVTELDASQRSELTDEEIEKWLDDTDFGYGVIYIAQRSGALKGAKWARDRQKGGKP